MNVQFFNFLYYNTLLFPETGRSILWNMKRGHSTAHYWSTHSRLPYLRYSVQYLVTYKGLATLMQPSGDSGDSKSSSHFKVPYTVTPASEITSDAGEASIERRRQLHLNGNGGIITLFFFIVFNYFTLPSCKLPTLLRTLLPIVLCILVCLYSNRLSLFHQKFTA